MEAFLIHNMAPIMFGCLVLFLLLGYPVAFALASNGLAFALIGIELGLFPTNFLQALPERVYGVMNNDTLLAIPFFTFMGLILERSGMAEDLLDTIGQLFGPIRGGLAYAVIFVGALLAATTGVVAASVISMGLISLPIMLRYGYDRRLASGVIAASGTLAQIIPPSLVLIVMADQLGRSVGDMYEGAIIPGLVLTALYAGYVLLITMIFPKAAPALPPEAQTLREPETLTNPLAPALAALIAAYVGWLVGGGLAELTAPMLGLDPFVMRLIWTALIAVVLFGPMQGLVRALTVSLGIVIALSVAIALFAMRYTDVKAGADYVVIAMTIGVIVAFIIACLNRLFRAKLLSKLAEQAVFVMVPPLALIFLVLGTIFIGIATPTEGGAMGATGALILALMKRRLSLRPDEAGHGFDGQALGLRRLHPDRRPRLLAHLLWRRRPQMGRGAAGRPAGRRGRLPDLRQHPGVRARLLPRLLRARLHHRAAARAGGGAAGDRPDLVRRDPGREHADLVHAPALRLRPVLPALGRAQSRPISTRSPASAWSR